MMIVGRETQPLDDQQVRCSCLLEQCNGLLLLLDDAGRYTILHYIPAHIFSYMEYIYISIFTHRDRSDRLTLSMQHHPLWPEHQTGEHHHFSFWCNFSGFFNGDIFRLFLTYTLIFLGTLGTLMVYNLAPYIMLIQIIAALLLISNF